MNTKNKKIITIILNVITAIICAMVLLIAVTSIANKDKPYTEIFGKAVYVVETDSMEGNNTDSFDVGDIIVIQILKTEAEKSALSPQSIITFRDEINGKEALNTHRIIRLGADGKSYVTRGDNSPIEDVPVAFSEVIGVYQSKIAWIGNISLFFKTSTGFLVLVVVPSILVVAYCAFLLANNVKKYNKEKLAIVAEAAKEEAQKTLSEEDKQKLKEDYLKELQVQMNKVPQESIDKDTPKN